MSDQGQPGRLLGVNPSTKNDEDCGPSAWPEFGNHVRLQPMGEVFIMSMRHASLVARRIGMSSISSSVTTTSNWC